MGALEPDLERTEFWQEQEAAERVEMRLQALRWLTLFLVFLVFLSMVLWWSTSVVQYGAARAAGTSEPTLELMGSVRDAQSGRPISWAIIADAQEDRKPPFFAANTDGEGNFHLLTLPEPHTVIISARGYRPHSLNIGTAWYRWRPVAKESLKVQLEPE